MLGSRFNLVLSERPILAFESHNAKNQLIFVWNGILSMTSGLMLRQNIVYLKISIN